VRYDLAIVGGGSTGAALAALSARRGLQVVLFERRPLAEAGARWVNDVPPWMFREAGLAEPQGDELYPASAAAHLLAGFGPRRVSLRRFDVVGVDVRHLQTRLLSDAEHAGARIRSGVSVHGVAPDGTHLETSEGTIRAEWIADASGLTGSGLMPRPRVAPHDICAAAQEMRRVTDLAGAHRFFERHGAAPDEGLSFLGIAGGFSTLSLRLVRGELFLLAGSIPATGHPSGGTILDRFAHEQRAWIGDAIFGGRRAIPLRHPYERLAEGRVALLGDAAGQVFAGHGSGTGAGLIAARMLSDALAAGRTPEAYGVAWQRRWGALFTAYDLVRRLTQTLDVTTLERLMAAGLFSERGLRAGCEQRWPKVAPDERPTLEGVSRRLRLRSLRAIPGALHGAFLARGHIARFAILFGRMAALRLHYARYPESPAGLPDWSRGLRRITGLAAESPSAVAPGAVGPREGQAA